MRNLRIAQNPANGLWYVMDNIVGVWLSVSIGYASSLEARTELARMLFA